MSADSSTGVTPLEAAARAAMAHVIKGHRWEDAPENARDYYRAEARAALSAAIEALPELLDTGSVWDGQMKTENYYEEHEGESVYMSRLKIVRGPWLRRAFGLGED